LLNTKNRRSISAFIITKIARLWKTRSLIIFSICFFKNSLDLLCIADLNGRFVKLNPEWANTLGYELSFLEGKAFIDFVHPDDKDETLRATRELASSQLITSFVNRYQCIDGSYRWIEWRSYPYNGLIYASARDITERKKNELKLIQSENRLNSIINIMQHDAKNEQQLLDYALDEAIRLTHSTIGYIYHYKEDTQEFILNSWSKSVMEECKIKDPKTCYALANTGIWGEAVRQRKPILINDFSSENQLKKGYPPGHVELSNFLTIPVFKGDLIIAVVGVGNKLTDYEEADILQLKLLMDATIKVLDKIRAEEALRKSENRYRLLFENMTSAFALHQMIYDENQTPIDYSYIEANPAFERLTGVPINTLIGKNVLSLLPDLEDHWIKTFGNVAKTGEPIRYINYVVDLQKYFDTYSFSPEKDQFAVVFNDITEQVKAEQALKESENRFRGWLKTCQ
jgi:PAS domain S-box-containing protein